MARETLTPKNAAPDTLLYETLDYLRSLPAGDRTAVVAGIYNQNTNELYVATSYQFRDPVTQKLTWNHAEEEVVNFAKKIGMMPRVGKIDSYAYLFLSSLSPCARPSSTRAHDSCTNQLTKVGFKSEHTGKIDSNAAKTGLYEEKGFTADLTTDPTLLTVCDGLYKFFIPFKKKGMNKETIIKKALESLPVKFYSLKVETLLSK